MFFFFFQAEDGIRDLYVTGVQTCALPILPDNFEQYTAGKAAVGEAAQWLKEGVVCIITLWNNVPLVVTAPPQDRKSTRLNSSHVEISYAVFCLKKKKHTDTRPERTHTLRN